MAFPDAALPAADDPANLVWHAASPETVLWGRLPCAADAPVLTIADGETVTIDTVSHEGILEDQGRDPVTYFGGHGVPADAVIRWKDGVPWQAPRW